MAGSRARASSGRPPEMIGAAGDAVVAGAIRLAHPPAGEKKAALKRLDGTATTVRSTGGVF
ncbi:hypothetical protein [Burkholderia sp. Tr-20390]|uniref:hypothetical protein n=1 Tax=Burkholderia sp. Tr-20390 TaxID=2703904 RepID=UPI00197D29D1|nr:hypothetical protein [Burkholderia sp. Tr-20390]MBN3734959.1 hypothetical protein [Burkholderia sp. Tr-20390]